MIRAQTKRVVRAVYAFRCGYCGITEAQCGAELTFDHFRPQSRQGADDAANLVYACHACNEFKGEYWSEDDETRLLHPLIDDLAQHFREESDATLKPLTPLGAIYIAQLQLNRPALLEHRLERRLLSRIENHLADMTATLREILAEIKRHQT